MWEKKFMTIKKAAGRPPVVDMKTIIRLSDAIQHCATVSDACRYAKISRTTYYHYQKNEPIFAEAMNTAKANQYKLSFSLFTPHY